MDECESKAKPNSCVGDIDELEVECWNCAFRWCIFRFYADKKSAKCPNCGMWNKKALRDALRETQLIETYLNSPQFHDRFVEREKVVEELKKKMIWGRYDCECVLDIIRTVGKED
jgi:hypothetical protein